jgi:hypothetical protein
VCVCVSYIRVENLSCLWDDSPDYKSSSPQSIRDIEFIDLVHFRIPDVCRRGWWTSWVVNLGTSTKTYRAGLWTISIPFDWSIYIERCLLRFESLYRTILSLRQDILGTPDQENHPPAFVLRIEFLIVGDNSWSGFHQKLPRDQGQCLLEPCHQGMCINMVGPARGNSQNSSSKYPTIGGSVASDAWTPSCNTPSFNCSE